MKVVIPCGAGQVGTVLARALHAGGGAAADLCRRWRALPAIPQPTRPIS